MSSDALIKMDVHRNGSAECLAVEIPIVVLTGGPCGGKTTFMRELRNEDPNCQQWVLVPEAAPLLFQAGLSASEKSFQAAVVRLQIALENSCAETAPFGATLVCHRGALDPLAYWLAAGWSRDEFFDCVGFTQDELLNRYAGVVHLQTTAVGAESFYRRWPDAHRPETIEQAAKIDDLCIRAWSEHQRQAVIENHGCDWPGKSQALRETLLRCLADAKPEWKG